MKTGRRMTGAAGAVLLLMTMNAGASYGAGPFCCDAGKVKAAGVGYKQPTLAVPSGVVISQRTVTLTCDAAVAGPAAPAWYQWTSGEKTLAVPPAPDKDGIYSTALTALADDKKVQFCYMSPTLTIPPALPGPPSPYQAIQGNINLFRVLDTPIQ